MILIIRHISKTFIVGAYLNSKFALLRLQYTEICVSLLTENLLGTGKNKPCLSHALLRTARACLATEQWLTFCQFGLVVKLLKCEVISIA